MCDFCTHCQRKLEQNPQDQCRVSYLLHKKKAEKLRKLRETFIKESKENTEGIAVFEFDYSQNLPLPKSNITSQFHKRLMWMFVFNVHIHNNDS